MPANWKHFEDIYHRAVALQRVARSKFLDDACGGDDELRREVEALLAEGSAPGFLDGTALGSAARGLASARDPMTAGRQLGRYTIVALVGRGGMGEVYRARDAKLGREVAVKFVPPVFAFDADRVVRLEHEARALAALNHPNIATIHELDEHDGQKLLILELVEGETLAERIARGRISIAETVRLALQMTEGLEAAHEKGIVHRDLKPSNIKITPEGRVKILDFGLARAGADGADGQTQGLLLGTAAYMSPEQARGEPVDSRTDIWSFGSVLYEMLTGKMAFGAETPAESLARVLDGKADLGLLPPETPEALRRIVRRCLEQDPRDRLRDIGDARIDLGELLNGAEPQGEAVAQGASSRRNFLRLAGAGGLVVAGASVASWATLRMRPEVSADPVRFRVGPMTLFPVRNGRSVSVSPDGRHVAYLSWEPPDSVARIKSMDQDEPRRVLPQTRGLTEAPIFSPDGDSMALFTEEGLVRMPVAGGAPAFIARLPVSTGSAGRVIGGSWHASGRIVYATSLGVFGVESTGASEPVELVLSSESETFAWPDVLPDGRSVLLTRLSASPAEAEIVRLDLQSREVTPILSGGTGAYYVSDGFLVYATVDGLAVVGFDAATNAAIGNPVQVPGTGVSVTGVYQAAHFAVSRNGTLARITGMPDPSDRPRARLVLVDREGRQEVVPTEFAVISYARFSPDGSRLALNVGDNNSRRIVTHDLVRGTAVQVSGAPGMQGEDLLPQWSPDGRRLYYASFRTGDPQIFSRSADGSGPEERLIENPNVQMPYRVDRADRMLFFSGPFGSARAGRIDPTNPSDWEWVLEGPYNAVNAVLSADGDWIAYESNMGGETYDVYIRPYPDVEGALFPVSAGGGRQPLWDPTRPDTLFYRRESGAIVAVRLSFSPELQVLSTTEVVPGVAGAIVVTSGGWSYDVSPRDGRFVLVRAEPTEVPPQAVDVTVHWLEDVKRRFPG